MIKAIDTSYKGYYFRSRLEARWAVFFDHLEIKYEYEPEGYILSTGERYLPDFKVSNKYGTTTWYDVKPLGYGWCDKLMQMKKDYIADGVRLNYFQILEGEPRDFITPDGKYDVCPRCGNIGNHDFFSFNYDYINFSCEACDDNTPMFLEHNPSEGLIVPVEIHKGIIIINDPQHGQEYWIKILRAANLARSSRFEFLNLQA